MTPIRRRTALLGLSAAWALGRSAMAVADAAPHARPGGPGDARLIVVILRGALDGLGAVVPYGDRNLAQWRGDLLPPEPGREGGLLDLGGSFGLHPALSRLHQFYAEGSALPVHAVAGHYRSRSHFEAQDFMESGADQRLTSGWLNRCVAALPRGDAGAGDAGPEGVGPEGLGLSLGLAVPLLLRGPATIGAYAPETGRRPDPALYAAIADLNAHDALTGGAWRDALRAQGYVAEALATPGTVPGVAPGAPSGSGGPKPSSFEVLAQACGTMLARPDGPRIAALETGGWDTHAGQKNRLPGALGTLDRGLGVLRAALGPAWGRSVVLVMTEFGRTVRMNGTGGTDHGTATVAFLLGGAVAGGRVGGTWPGLATGQLFENRDLAPTTDLRAIAKGVLHDHLGIARPKLDIVFPQSADIAPATGLIRI